MSKIYEALQRLEWERADHRARKQGTPRTGDSWKGMLVGCVLGLGVGIVLSASVFDRQPPARTPAPSVAALAPPSPPEPTATAAVVVEQASAESEPVAPAPASGPVAIQVGTFRNHDNGVRLAARLAAEGYRVTIEPSRTDDRLWMVRVEGFADRGAAEAARVALGRLGVSGLLVSSSLERNLEGASRHARASDSGAR